jgi:ATP-dependent Clp protease ATP-binding subunit ClpC
MFERFTDRARRVVVLAQEEARLLDHNWIGTEHILLGLLREGEGVAARALESLGISLDAVRQQVEEIIGRGQHPQAGHIPFTPRAKKVLELSLREALQLGHTYIGTEHILLGLIREGDGVAAQVLVRMGADLDRTRLQIIEQLRGRREEGVIRVGPGADTLADRLASIAARLTAIEIRLRESGTNPGASGLRGSPRRGQDAAQQAVVPALP